MYLFNAFNTNAIHDVVVNGATLTAKLLCRNWPLKSLTSGAPNVVAALQLADAKPPTKAGVTPAGTANRLPASSCVAPHPSQLLQEKNPLSFATKRLSSECKHKRLTRLNCLRIVTALLLAIHPSSCNSSSTSCPGLRLPCKDQRHAGPNARCITACCLTVGGYGP